MKHFVKPALTLDQQINLLKTRRLAIPDMGRARRYLQYISYYRLAAYGRPYHISGEEDHIFQPGVTFDDVLDLYIFDRKLRLHILDAIERIEVAVRAVLNNHMSLEYSQYWHLDKTLFSSKFDHSAFIELLTAHTRNGQHPFCKAYHAKYSYPTLPPSWMVSEILDFGKLSKVLASLAHAKDKKAIASAFNTSYSILESWLWSLTILRNTCAHHGLVWNRIFTHSPKFEAEFSVPSLHHFYARAIVIWQFLKVITKNSQWLHGLKQLLIICPRPMSEMGFPDGWQLSYGW
jgi:Abortive infection bacteriophage resistance protein